MESKDSAFDNDLSKSSYLEHLITTASNKTYCKLDSVLTSDREKTTSLNSEKSFATASREISSEDSPSVSTL